MARSVIRESCPRCEGCRLPPRWCICGGLVPVACTLAVDVVFHSREYWRPTSTGRLINRLMPDSRAHVFRHDAPLTAQAVSRPGRELWILHPQGDPAPADPQPGSTQLLLLDGSWREAARMMHQIKGWGRLVNLPMSGESDYRLRDQHEPGKQSTVEALIFALRLFGLQNEAASLHRQFLLHVYAGLRARGQKLRASEFLEETKLRSVYPELISALNERHSPAGTDEGLI